jgi:hypothetical protein
MMAGGKLAAPGGEWRVAADLKFALAPCFRHEYHSGFEIVNFVKC